MNWKDTAIVTALALCFTPWALVEFKAPLTGWPDHGCDRQLATYGDGREIAQHELALFGVVERPSPIMVPVGPAQMGQNVSVGLFGARRAVIALGCPEGCAETPADL